ncbi:hypothetical protein MD484_g3255, partial [Candolleomyces efflorescens]
MPPRRSSRAPSVKPEAPLPAETAAPKRKRKTTEDNDEGGDAKSAPKTRRASSSKPPSKATATRRVSNRSKPSLADVAESDDEAQSDAPPVRKKSRPSAESDLRDDEDDAEAEEESKSSKRKGKKAMQVDDEDEEEEEAPAPLPKRRTSSRQPSAGPSRRASSSNAARGGRRARVTSVAETVPEDEEEEEEERPAPAKRRGGRAAKQVQDSDEEAQQSDQDEDAYESDKPKPKGRKGKAPARSTKKPSKKVVPKVVVVGSSQDEEEDSDSPPPAAPPKTPKKEPASPVKPSQGPQPGVEEEEETSLFDPIPIPKPADLPQAVEEEPQGPKARLVIHKLALVNFKSYAGRQEIGPFHKSFSAIVGPNGSGKSNTIDALLFVFGYRASKMRQGKVSELIHNSARHPDLDECSVEVHFRDIIDKPGADDFEVIPGSRLVVARTAFKNNQSKYTINGKNSSYKEVQALLKGRGIDLDHNRFLILQGEVESIAQMKPKAPSEHEDGLLEYLEDIIGTSAYKQRIDDALTTLEQLQEDRQSKLNRLRLVEKEKLALEEQRREAINYYKLKNDHIKAQSVLCQYMIWKWWERHTALEKDHGKYTKELENETARNKQDIEHLEDLQKHYEEIEEVFKEIEEVAETGSKDLKEMDKKVVGLEEKQKHTESRYKKLKKAVQEDTKALRNAEEADKDSTATLEKQRAKLSEHQATLVVEEAELEKVQEGLRGKTQVFHDQIQKKQKELQPWTSKIDASKAAIDVREGQRDTLQDRADKRREALDEAQMTFDDLVREQEARSNEQKGFKDKKDRLKQDIANSSRRVEDAKRNLDQWRSKAMSARNTFDEAKASQSANRSQGAVVNGLQALKDQGRLHGFHGKLGALGTIDGKYDVAISTAAGGPLSNMVVDTVDQGKICIDYLRANNLGRASFMVLEKLPNSNRMDPFQTPEGVPRLFDLVKPKNPMYRKAFYKALGDTLVADGLDQANRIAFGARRFRVVTLDGQIIETSGAMSGGGGQPSRGAMSAKQAADTVSPTTLKKYEQDAAACAQELSQATKEFQEAEAELDTLKRREPELEMEYQKLGMELTTRKARIAEIQKRVADLKAHNQPDAADQDRIQTLDREIASEKAKLKSIQAKADEITNAIAALEQKIMDIGGAKLMMQKAKVDAERTYIDLAEKAISKAEETKAKAESDIKRLGQAITTNEATLSQVKKELTELNQEVVEAQQYRDELAKKVNQAQAELDNQKDRLDEEKEKLEEAEKAVAGFRKKEMELNQKLADLAKEIEGAQHAIDNFQTDHDKLRLHDIDEDDDESDDEDEERREGSTPGAEEQEAGADGEAGPSRPRAKKDQELKVYSSEELRRLNRDELVADTELLDEKIKNAKVDLTVLKEYKKREAEFDNRAKDVERVTEQRDAQKAHYDGLRKQRLDEFMTGFNTISLKLKEMYQMITLGGNAELELVDSLDPFSEGIIFSVMPPKKSWKNISNLSGGEKTLSSLALVFALHVFKPTPLYFMDEIDAALDFRNVSIVANYIKDRTKNAQFIIISLRNDMFELSHRLIGIYKTSNATRSVSIDNHKLLTTVPVVVPPPATNASS